MASSFGWSFTGSAAFAALQLLYASIMGRLLIPEDFGLLAMAVVLTRFAGYISQMGLGPALIHKSEVTRQDERAALTLAIALGVTFTAVFALAAPLAGVLYRNTAVVPVVRAMGFVFLASGFSAVPLNLLRRAMRFRALALVENGSFAVGLLAVGVPLAMNGYGVWSLVAAGLAHAVLTALFAFMARPCSLVPVIDPTAYRSLLGYGSHYSLNTVLDLIYGNIEVLLVGRWHGVVCTGLYNRAFALANTPVYHFAASLTRVLFPALSRLSRDRRALGRLFERVAGLVAAGAGAVSAGIIVGAHEIVRVVLGPGWGQAVFALQCLAAAVPFQFMISCFWVLFNSTGELGAKTWYQCVGLSLKVALLVVLGLHDFRLFMVAIPLSTALQQILVGFAGQRLLIGSWTRIGALYWRGLVAAILSGALVFGARHLAGGVSDGSPFVLLFAEILGGGLAVVLLALLFWRSELAAAAATLREGVRCASRSAASRR